MNMQHLSSEQSHPHLAEFLRSGGTLEVGESVSLGSFARLRIGNTTLNVVKATYQDFAEVLKEMDSQARQYFERRDKT